MALANHKEANMYNPNTCTWEPEISEQYWWLVTKYSTHSCVLQKLHILQNGYSEEDQNKVLVRTVIHWKEYKMA